MALLMRPGYTLLLAGLVSFLVSRFIGVVPLVGGILTGMLALFGMFAIVGGIWLVIAERRAGQA